MRFYQLELVLKGKPTGFVNEKAVYAEGEEKGILSTEWFGTERDAAQARSDLYKAGKLYGLKRESKIYPVDVPTDKAGLLKFLKENVRVPVII